MKLILGFSMKTSVFISFLFFFIFSVSTLQAMGLKREFKNDFLIGAALNTDGFSEKNKQTTDLIENQFNSITSENVLKWENIHPSLNQYNFQLADKFVQFGEKNHMTIIGHTLIWHQQTPSWVFIDENGKPLNRDQLLERMHDHIFTVMQHFKGKIHGWDVVNEALNDDGILRQSPWMQIIGEDYIIKAFEYAHEADPSAELYYNDYGLENEAKRAGAVALIQKLQEHHIPIKAIGLQEHNSLDWPSTQQIDATLNTFEKLGIKVNITELDVDVLPQAYQLQNVNLTPEMQKNLNPYSQGIPDAVNNALADRYAALFKVYLKHHQVIERITFWGVTDQDSWLNYFPIKGRVNYPLLFDRNGQPKIAFQKIVSIKKSKAIS